jgi:aromatic ring-cleaving dioxygenase
MTNAPESAAQPRDTSAIADYHAHIYYDPATTRDRAARVRGWMEERFPAARMGRWHDVPVGPHPRAMYQIAFPADLLPAILPWLMLNRLGLPVLLHPNTDNARDDHLVHAVWMGEILPLNADVL